MSEGPPEWRVWKPVPASRYVHFPVLDLEADYEQRLRFPVGRHRVVLGLGGLSVEIRTNGDGLVDFLQQTFGSFLEESEPDVRLQICQADGELPFQRQFGTLAMYQRGPRVVGRFRDMVGYIDADTRDGRGLFVGDNYRQDFSNYMRLVVHSMMPAFGAVLFHTAAIARDGGAYVFYGQANAGKSTISALAARRYEVMTDDMLVLRLEAGEVRAVTCGFWGGETRIYPSKRLDLPVRGFYRLKKGPANAVRPLGPTEGALDIVCGVPSMSRPPGHNRRILEFATAAAAAVPCRELEFSKDDDSFWSVIDV